MKMYPKSLEKANTISPFATFVVKRFSSLFYRINTIDMESIPLEGPALLVSNHVTSVDSMLIAASCKRRICLVINKKLLENSKLRWLYKLMNVITVSSDMSEPELTEALGQAKAALDDGHLVSVFPEEDISGNGNMRQFTNYLLDVIKDVDAPIIPFHIGGAWGSMFSNFHDALISTRSRKWPCYVTLTFGSKRAANSSAADLRLIVQKLSVTYMNSLKSADRNLGYYFIKTARANWSHEAIGDTTGKRMNFGMTLITSIALGKKLADITAPEEKVGIILPASVAGALSNIALTIRNRVAVNINFSISSDAINVAIKNCKIEKIITSRKVMRHLPKLELSAELIYIEDLIKSITSLDKVNALLCAIFSHARTIADEKYPDSNDLATIIFSSGSTGEQKGIMLSHHNIISNIESFLMIYHFKNDDKMCGILPFFHSFGYATTLWCPLMKGFTAFYHPNPLEGETIARIVREEQLTILLATPTFLMTYIRKASYDDFQTLRVAITGAEKLRKNISASFNDKFKIRPTEGYGATELSPVGAANIPVDEKTAQLGTKDGSIGQPIPGVAMRITDLDSAEPLPVNAEGMLEVKGPNVMLGYLDNQALTDSVMREGWYITGDIARIDEDGFVFIHDRLSRFSKIAGEMVPHVLIEEIILKELDIPANSIFVASAPDHKRGEQLIVIHTAEATASSDLRHIIHKSDIPHLWKPRRHNYLEIEKMPVTGSGKLNMRELSQIARDFIEDQPTLLEKTITKIKDSF